MRYVHKVGFFKRRQFEPLDETVVEPVHAVLILRYMPPIDCRIERRNCGGFFLDKFSSNVTEVAGGSGIGCGL